MKMERSKNKTKKKQKTAIIFALKQNVIKNPPSFLLRSEMKRNGSEIFSLRCEKSVFSLFSHLKQNKNEKEAKTKRKRSKTKNFWKRNKAKIRCINFALIGSKKFEAKRSERKRKKNADLVSLRFTLKRKNFFCETGAPYPDPSRLT